jgi:NDP-sugar pyrophosphorylase family protein
MSVDRFKIFDLYGLIYVFDQRGFRHMRHVINVNGGWTIPKHTAIGQKTEAIPAYSVIGPYCSISAGTVVGDGTVVGVGCKVQSGVHFCRGVVIRKDARIRGTVDNPVTFDEGVTIARGAELRHVHFRSGVRLAGDISLHNCVLPSDTIFEEKHTIRVTGYLKKLKVAKPYKWPTEVPAKPSGQRGKETRTPEEQEAVREANYRRQAEEALGALQQEAMASDDFDIIENVEDLDRRIAGRTVLFYDGKHYPLMADHVKAVFLEQLAQGKWS